MTFQELLIIPEALYILAVLLFALLQPLRSDTSKLSYSVSFLLHGVTMIFVWPFVGLMFMYLGPVLEFAGKVMTSPIKTLFQQ
jgi:putative effector of murein hydrolase LrgA (UPF0299 family)